MKYFLPLHFLVFAIFNLSAQDITKSVHQEQSEYYSQFNFKEQKQWDSLRLAENGMPHSSEKNVPSFACNLQKRVFGWNPYWAGSAYNNYKWNLLSDLCHFSYEVNPNNGQPITTHNWLTDPAVTAAKNNGVKISLCATLFSNHATFLTNASSKQTFINNIISLIQQRGANGCNIDFEGVPASQSANLTAFMIDLCNQMHAAIPGSEVSVALPAVDWSAVWDVNAMANHVDLFIIMGYDYYWGGSTTAGPTDPLYNFDPSYNYTLTKSITYYLNKGVPRNKLLLGLPYYGREYVTTSNTIPSSVVNPPNSVTRTFTFVKTNASGNYSAQLWDANSFSPYYVFYNNGNWNQCFINSGYSIGKRFDIVNQFGIGGIGIWALSYDNGYMDYWNKIEEKFTDCAIIPCSDTIYDMGGPNGNYYNNEDYTFTIAPTGAAGVSLSFTSFNTQSGNDVLSIYDGPTTTSPLIGNYSGTSSPGTVNSSGSSLTLKWISNTSTVSSGWMAVWNCTFPSPTNLSVTQNYCPSIGVILSWQNSGNGWFVDVTDDPTFTNFWNKNVSGLTTIGCPGGFANINNPNDFLQFRPNTTYYWRIWDGNTHTNGTPFTTPVCTTIDSSCLGTLDDSGGPSAPHGGNEDWTYTIAPPFAASVTINFSSFDLENGFDSLYIHNGASTNDPLLGGYTGTNSPGIVTANSGTMTIHFVSDPFVNNAGFTSSWTCVQNTSSQENENNPKVLLFPNPSKGKFLISCLKNYIEKIEVYNLPGKKVFEFIPLESTHSIIELSLPQDSRVAGMYFLKLKTTNQQHILKLIIIE